MSTITESVTNENDRVRLHITPLNPDLYEKIIPSSIRKPDCKVSFHVVQTHPERGFGYLEVSKADAEALKRKLNGSMLKGAKIRIEQAKPIMKRKVETEEEPVKERKKKVKTEDPRTKKRDIIMPGYELDTDRHVKRGWTEDKAGRKSKSAADTPLKTSKVTDDKKLLFKTVVPPNTSLPAEEKSKKRGEKRKSRTKKGEMTVEEFGKTRSTFAVSHASSIERKAAVAYEDGVGWVDEDGEVVEPEPERLRRQHRSRVAQKTGIVPAKLASSTSPALPAQTSATTAEDATVNPSVETTTNDHAVSEAEADSDSAASSSDAASLPSEEEADAGSTTSSSDGASSSSEEDPEEPSHNPVSVEVHPLEALYKRAKADAKDHLAPINTSFSFFDAAEDVMEEAEEEEETAMIPPQTPHAKQDLEWRHQRSAAPTPDTAAIDGRFGFPFGPPASDDEELTPTETATAAIATQPHHINGEQEESAFRKFFYEKRGDLDRAWKKRRREMKKLQRQRENRRLNRRIV